MEKRFRVSEMHICPVYRIGTNFKPDLEYPTRYCVIDNEREIAIDIKTKLKYDYVKTMSNLYFLSQSFEKIKGNNRVAIFPYANVNFDKYDIADVSIIIEQLKKDEQFQDGNEVYNNEQYLEYLKEEKLIELNQSTSNKEKTKKLGKRKK
ncbi:MAG: hypothetical protein IKL65_04405 [Bacilli bacterium]|nr:hypothetical protein [Bacilli bacterium]